jgi:alginate O-acetyltransferase complex protein AlgI
MLFNSYPFLLVFLPAALLLSAVVDRWASLRIAVLIVLSLSFYSYWSLAYLPILVGSIAFNWLAALAFVRTKHRAIVTGAIAADIALLGFFKYSNYFLNNAELLLDRPISHLSIIAPLGISFFTFHHIMYLVDLRRGRVGLFSFDRYALYICFFPQLIAGPLARWGQVVHQFGRAMLRPDWEQRFVAGLTLIAIGLVEKVFLSDQMAGIIGPVFAQAQAGAVSEGSAWLTLGFGFEVFFDFAGYSDIAIGLGRLFGIELPQNFNAPFRATSIQDFWRRWHITLTLFLRDYLFLPLCDVRIGGRRHVLAAMVATMTLCGLWHGAGWNYVVWGALHGLALALATLWPQRAPPPVRRALTIAFVLITAILFGAGSLQGALHIFAGLARSPNLDQLAMAWPIYLAAACAALPSGQALCARLTDRPTRAAAAAVALSAAAILLRFGGNETYDFVYFQF